MHEIEDISQYRRSEILLYGVKLTARTESILTSLTLNHCRISTSGNKTTSLCDNGTEKSHSLSTKTPIYKSFSSFTALFIVMNDSVFVMRVYFYIYTFIKMVHSFIFL